MKKTQKLKNGKYEIGIPWRKNEPTFDNNFEFAMSRLKSQEKSLLKQGQNISQTYFRIIEDYEAKEYVRKVPKKNEQQWFLPLFPVIREERATTKERIVFDAAFFNVVATQKKIRSF